MGAKRTAPRLGVQESALRPNWGRVHGGHFSDPQWGQLPKTFGPVIAGFPGYPGPGSLGLVSKYSATPDVRTWLQEPQES